MERTTIAVDPHLDLGSTLAPLRHGSIDPTIKITAKEAVRATNTPDGPTTVHLKHAGDLVTATAWGPGAVWALGRAPSWLGHEDAPSDFRPGDPLLGRLHRENPGLRMCRSLAAVELAVPTILEQKVTTKEATRSYAALVHRYGTPAPGPARLKVPPAPETLAELPYFAFHPLGIERRRAEVLRRICSVADRIDAVVERGSADLQRALLSIPGIGPWTTAIVAQAALGDPDAVITGDYHLPNIVGWALAGKPRSTDAEMLSLLAPYRGHRARATRLIVGAGFRAPSFGPKRPLRDIAGL